MNRRRIAPCAAVLVLGSVLVPVAAHYAAAADRPWMNKALPPAQRAKMLVAAMTLDEKVQQIHMVDVPDNPREVAGIPRLGIETFKISNGPSGAGPGDAKHSPKATALPSPLALSASWDTGLANQFGKIAGQEVSFRPEHLIEAPGVNIARVPRNGRNFEYFGEDPYLSGQMSLNEVKGIQSTGTLAEVKHFAVNNQETKRKSLNAVVDERTLREIYLPAFEATVQQGDVAAIMCAYPKLNGTFDCENTHLLQDILRKEWGFDGFVQSDYTATHSTVAAANAGLDLSMRHDFYGDATKQAIQQGQLKESVVDGLLIHRYTQMFKFGFFDNPPTHRTIDAAADGAVARSIAEQGAVLLKNSAHQLPLSATKLKSIALIGPYAKGAHTGGRGSSRVSPLYTVTPTAGIKNIVGNGVTVTFNDGSDTAAAAAAAKVADVAIVMVGNTDTEGADRGNISLPSGQDAIVDAVANVSRHTVVVLKTGGPVLMPWLNKVEAVLEAWYPGEEDGNAVARLLFGKVNPSGRLTMSFPKSETDTPANTAEQYPGVNATAHYTEGLQVGYRWYDTHKNPPLFPFGFGLSYTTFSLTNLSAPKTTSGNGAITVSVDVKNTGDLAGADIVEVYVSAPASAGEPPKQLKGFAKVSLKPGETKRVSITLQNRAFSSWNTKAGKWTVVSGTHTILVGDSIRDLSLKSQITVG